MLTWTYLLPLILGTGIVTTLLNQAATAVRERRSTKKNGAYLGLRLAVTLESFAQSCMQYISDNAMHSSSGGHAGARRVALPELIPYVEDENGWRALAPDLAERALSIRNRIASSSRAIDFWWEIDDDCMPGACDEECAILGDEAWEIARDLRRRYGFREFISSVDFSAKLADLAHRARQRRGVP